MRKEDAFVIIVVSLVVAAIAIFTVKMQFQTICVESGGTLTDAGGCTRDP